MATEERIKTPGYYIRKRLFANKPAMFCLVIIILAHIVALLGYAIMPDNTPDANDGAWQIQKLPAGAEVDMLKKRKTTDWVETGFFEGLLFGYETNYTILAIKSFEIHGMNVDVVPYGRIDKKETHNLLTIVKPVFQGPSTLIFPDGSQNFSIKGENVTYLDYNGVVCYTTQTELFDEFMKNNIDHRTYWLGTDKAGRDIFSRLILGTRISLGIGFVAVLISLTLGITLGSLAGFFRGGVDSFIMWLMTVVWSIPSIMLVIAISLALQSKDVWVAFVAVGVTTWVEVARVVRGQILSVREKTYVEAARALGLGNGRIIFVHILPNLIGPIIVIATSNFASAIMMEAGLSFLGLGVQPPTPSWGMMINEGFHSIGTQGGWNLVMWPSLSISILVLCFNLFGNGLRDAFDPQSKSKAW